MKTLIEILVYQTKDGVERPTAEGELGASGDLARYRTPKSPGEFVLRDDRVFTAAPIRIRFRPKSDWRARGDQRGSSSDDYHFNGAFSGRKLCTWSTFLPAHANS